jgi:hypothetical protein
MTYKIIEINHKYSEFVYAGPVFGYAQIALAYVSYILNKKATLVLEHREHKWHLTKFAMIFGPKIIEVNQPTTLKKVQKVAENYVENNNNNKYLLSFGLYSNIDILAEQLKKAIPVFMKDPKRLWIVAGSATILNALYKIFPTTYFNVVQVGKKIWTDQLDEKRTKLYISEEYFTKIAKKQPPYPTVATYDAKLWTFVLKYGENGDFIWNVGKDIFQ